MKLVLNLIGIMVCRLSTLAVNAVYWKGARRSLLQYT
jgi:hypothetical protein